MDAIPDAIPGGWRRDQMEGATVYVSDSPLLKGISIIDGGFVASKLTGPPQPRVYSGLWRVYSGLKLSEPIDGDRLIIDGVLLMSVRTLKDAAYLVTERVCHLKWTTASVFTSDDGRFVVEQLVGTDRYRLFDKGNLVRVYASAQAAKDVAIGIKMKEVSDGVTE